MVLPQELENVVQKRADQGGMKGKRKKQSTPSKPSQQPAPPALLDPSKLAVGDNSFVTPHGVLVPQVSLQTTGPKVPSSLLWRRLLRSLAFVVLNADKAMLRTSLSWSSLRVVLRCQANGEPMLAPAFLVQLGHVPVIPNIASAKEEALHAPTCCFKIALYRDEIESEWSSAVQSPVKYVLARLPPLQVCQEGTQQNPCRCNKWHPGPNDQVEDPVLDIWRWQWLSMSFRTAAPDHAELFLFNLCCLAVLQMPLLNCSGRAGIYIEPRTLDSRDPVLDFQVLWLPKTPHDKLLRIQQTTNPQVLGLARMGSRLGIRSKLDDAASLARLLKPGSIFIGSPFGLDRLTVSKLCGQWGWQARPLHPSRSVEGTLGNLWLVKACANPPSAVVKYQGNDVVMLLLILLSCLVRFSWISMLVGSCLSLLSR